MKLLLDTHVFIWWATNRNRLSATALNLCQNRHNEIYLSLISLWEMQIKIQLGKLHFNLPLPQLIAEQQRLNDLRLLSLAPAHIYALEQLPFHHKDPFDRLLVAQASSEKLPLLSADPVFAAYSVQTIW